MFSTTRYAISLFMSHTGAIEYNSVELDFLTQINNSDSEFIEQ